MALWAVEKEIALPSMHPRQRDIMLHPARFKVVAAGRRFGKSRLGVMKSIRVAAGDRWWLPDNKRPGRAWWVPPLYKQGRVAWRSLHKAALTIPGTIIRRGDWEIELANGGTVTIMTGKDPDALRSEGLDFVVLDEAAFMVQEVWTDALRPSLSDRIGAALFISTPQGKNWFYDIYERAESLDNWARWQFATADNPYIAAGEIEDARLELGSVKFGQEYLAQFVEIEGDLFKRRFFDQTFTRMTYEEDGEPQTLYLVAGEQIDARDCTHFATVDLAFSLKTWADYTAVAVVAQTPKQQMLVLDMMHDRMEGPDIVPALSRLVDEWELKQVGIEQVQAQLAIVQEARRSGLPVKPLRPDRDKLARALPLAARMEAGDVFFPAGAPWLEDLRHEMLMFPDPKTHDDQVDALAYAAEMIRAQRRWRAS